MKTKNGFTLLENQKDVKDWLAKQHVSRKITKLQLHHMDMKKITYMSMKMVIVNH